MNGLIKGTQYYFKVQAVNSVGPGLDSPVLTVIAADKPNQPDAPINVLSLTNQS